MKENYDLTRLIGDIEAREANTSRSKTGLQTLLDEHQAQFETIKNKLSSQLRAAQLEIDNLNEELETVN